jgi:hypothetical protein
VGDWCAITWRNCTWRGWCIRFNPPIPNEVLQVRPPSSYVGWRGEASNYEHGSIYWTWVMVACKALTAFGGRGNLVGPPPINWVMHARHYQPTQEPIFNSRIFTGVLNVGDYLCCYVAWQHLAWVGVFARTPLPPDLVVHVRAFIGLRGPDVMRRDLY